MVNPTAIFIDAGYVSKIFGYPDVKIDYTKLCDFLCNPVNLHGVFYYDCMPWQSSPPTILESERFRKADSFITHLRSIPKFQVKLGRLQKRVIYGQDDFTQKGVDVMLAVDLVTMSTSKTITNAIIMAGDSDFVYAIDLARKSGVYVQLYYSNPINFDLFSVADKKTKIDEQLLDRCRKN